MMRRLLFLVRALWPLLFCPAVLGCESGQLDPATEERSAVVVDVTGVLVDSAAPDEADLSGISVGVFVASADGERKAASESTGANGQGHFEIANVELRPWEETYELVVTDSSGTYRERTLAVFALTAGTLDYGEIGLSRVDSGSFTQVRGQVRDASSGVPVASAELVFFDESQAEVAAVTTDDQGEFSVEGLLVQGYRLHIEAPEVRTAAAPNGYIPDDFDVPLAATTDNNLGSLFVAPKRLDDELLLVFSGPKTVADDGRSSERCLERLPGPSADAEFRGASHLFLPPDTLDVNGAYGVRKQRWGSEGLTRPDGFGFGTQFWPVFLGLRSGSSEATTVVPVGREYEPVEEDGIRYGQELRKSGEDTFVVARVFDYEDVRIETMTVLEKNPLASEPESLAYYYPAGQDRHYPVGVGLFSANVTCFETAELKVYQGDRFVGRFELGKNAEVRQLGELTEWAPLLLEYGFTHNFPRDSKDNPKPNDALYFNVIPFSALDLTLESPVQAYEQPAGISGFGPGVQGWDPVPDSLVAAASGLEHAVFIGHSQGASGFWVLDGSAGPVRAVTYLAGQNELLPAGATVLAANLAVFGRGAEVGAVLVRDGDQTSVAQWLPDERTFPFDCGTPTSLGYVGGVLLVGTESGVMTADCGVASEPQSGSTATWVRDVVAAGDAPTSPVTLIREHENESGFVQLMLGTRGDGLWIGDPGNAGWQRVQGIDAGATITDFAVLDEQLFISSETTLYAFVDGQARALGSLANGDFPGVDSTATQRDAPRVRALAAFRGRLYVGTTTGAFVYDVARRAACESDPESPVCSGSAMTSLLGFPDVAVNDFATLAGRLYALSDLGLFELLPPDTSLAGAVSDSESIAGLEGIALPQGGGLPPPQDSMTMMGMAGMPPLGQGGAPMNPPPNGAGGAPLNPPPPNGTGGAPLNPPPNGMGGAPLNPPPGSGGAPMFPPPPGSGGAPRNPPPNGMGGAPRFPPPQGSGGAP